MSEPQTFVYSTGNDCEIHLDLYLPDTLVSQEAPIPAVVFFHGGGLFRGSRRSILSELKDAALSNNWAFVSADYRLLLPSTGFDVLADIAALFSFLTTLPIIDTTRILVAGHSGGAYVARQAAIHGTPRPRALFSVSGQGGELLNPAYFTPNPYVQKKLLGPYKKYSTRDSPEVARKVPEIGSRLWLSIMASVTGTRLDYLTGKQGFSKVLLESYTRDSEVDLAALVPQDLKVLFPELMIGKEFPPSFVLHGTGDKNVAMRESEKTVRELERMDVECEFVAAENWGHGWSAEVWKRWGKDIMPFFEKCIAVKA
ncbi:alpha/beta-hydrolase [Morchella snyderi]|nr:alpha/beta-hydrolase [Morchella snyderi]